MYYLTFQTATSHTLLYPVLRGGRLEGVCDSGCSNVQVYPTTNFCEVYGVKSASCWSGFHQVCGFVRGYDFVAHDVKQHLRPCSLKA